MAREEYPAVHAAGESNFLPQVLRQPGTRIREIMRDVSRDHFELAVHDLLTMPDDGVILVDVFCGDSMAELRKVTDPERLIVLVPSKEFHAAEYRRRFQGQAGSKSLNVFREALAGCPDPETTFMAGWVQYHLSINQHSRDE